MVLDFGGTLSARGPRPLALKLKGVPCGAYPSAEPAGQPCPAVLSLAVPVGPSRRPRTRLGGPARIALGRPEPEPAPLPSPAQVASPRREALPARPVPGHPPRRGRGTPPSKRRGGSAASPADSPAGRAAAAGEDISNPSPQDPAQPARGPAARPGVRRARTCRVRSPAPVPPIPPEPPALTGAGCAARPAALAAGACGWRGRRGRAGLLRWLRGRGAAAGSLLPRPSRAPAPPRPPPRALTSRRLRRALPAAAGPGRGGRLRGSPRARAQRRRWQSPSAEGAGGRRKDKSRRRRRGGGLGSQRKTEVSEDGRGLSAPAQGAPCSARLGRGAQVTVAEVSRAGPVAVLAPDVKRDRQPIGRGLGFLF